GLRDCRLERRCAGNCGNVFTGVCVCCGDREIFAEVAEVADGERVFGWSECSCGGVDGVCGMAVCSRDVGECAGGSYWSDFGAAGPAIPSQFGLGNFRWSGRGVFGESRPSCVRLLPHKMKKPQGKSGPVLQKKFARYGIRAILPEAPGARMSMCDCGASLSCN